MNRSNPAFVTGASGFIGRHLVRRLLSEDRRVIALCRHPEDLKDFEDPRLEIVVGALENPHTYDHKLNNDISVIHLAATRNISGTPVNLYQSVNVDSTLIFAKLALDRGISRFIHVSTALVYGPSDRTPIDETSTWDPESSQSLYIRSRVTGQRGIHNLAEDGLRVITICPTLVYGPDHPSHPNRLTSQARRLLKTRLDIVVGKGDQRRNLVAVEDLIEGILLAEASEYFGESFILGGENCSHRAFNREVLSMQGTKPTLRMSIPSQIVAPLAHIGDRVRGYHPGAGYTQALRMLTREWRYTSRKATMLLDYKPHTLQEGLGQLIKFIEQEDSSEKYNHGH
jgi:nucleoside-diphosphate-sugar epimerase